MDARLDPTTPLKDLLKAERPATILVADDEVIARKLVRRVLQRAGYRVIEASDGASAIELAATDPPDLFILDISMPGIDGVSVCRLVKADVRMRLTPVIHITGSVLRDELLAALAAGSDDFVAKPFDIEELLTRVRSLLRTKRLTDQLVHTEAVMVALAKTVEARDQYTEQHLLRVAGRAVLVAQRLGMGAAAEETVRLGGLLHDLGKIGVPDAILLKAGPLTRLEFELVRRHPAIGAEIVRPLGSFTDPEPVVLHHHERWDGQGYPDGLRGPAIPLPARVVAVADAFDAMTSDRPYRPSMPIGTALQRLADGRASQWDPDAIDAFLGLFGDESAPKADAIRGT